MGLPRDGLEPLAWAWAPLGRQDEEPVEAVLVAAVVPVPGAVVARLAAVVALAPLGREEAGQQVPSVADAG